VARARKELDESTFEGKFAARLRHLMKRSDVDATKLALECGVTRRAVDHWLAGRRYPTIDRLPVIAQALGVSSPRNLIPND
jgi:transcriptional regulator with XRE-family HTH domain